MASYDPHYRKKGLLRPSQAEVFLPFNPPGAMSWAILRGPFRAGIFEAISVPRALPWAILCRPFRAKYSGGLARPESAKGVA
jgi:hypothetical protein